MSFDVNDDGWLPRRGDYGAHYAADLIPLVEATSCHLGCALPAHEWTDGVLAAEHSRWEAGERDATARDAYTEHARRTAHTEGAPQ